MRVTPGIRWLLAKLGFVATLVAIVVVGPATEAFADAFAIRDVRVFDGRQVLRHRTVVVRDGRIAAVDPANDLLLVDGDPTTDVTATENIVKVWKRGIPVARDKAP